MKFVLHNFEGLGFVILLAFDRVTVLTAGRTALVGLGCGNCWLLVHVDCDSDCRNHWNMTDYNHFSVVAHMNTWIDRLVAVSNHSNDLLVVVGCRAVSVVADCIFLSSYHLDGMISDTCCFWL